MRISDWSSDVCSSDLREAAHFDGQVAAIGVVTEDERHMDVLASREEVDGLFAGADLAPDVELPGDLDVGGGLIAGVGHVDDDVELVTESSDVVDPRGGHRRLDRTSTRLNSSH